MKNINQQYIQDHKNRMQPSCWLRLHQMQMQLEFCHQYGATEEMYFLPELPKELLARLDGIELEHLGPVAEVIGEATTTDEEGLLRAYDSAPHRIFAELQKYPFKLEKEFSGGAGFLRLYSSDAKPNVLYLLESDGESGCWLGTRFGHYIDNCNL